MRRSQFRVARERALAIPGTPVPGTGLSSRLKMRGKRLRPYERRRAGGGVRKDVSIPWGPRIES